MKRVAETSGQVGRGIQPPARHASVASAEARYQRFLCTVRPRLGPTQWEHLTSHSQRVARLAARLGAALGIGAADMQRLRLAGLLHDVGKLYIPERILAKPGRLSVAERRLVEQHSEEGARLARAFGCDARTAAFVRFHHVRFDAVPAASRRARSDVPLAALVLAAADAFVSMTTQRPYQRRRSALDALVEIRRHSGGQFDPRVVAAFPSSLARGRSGRSFLRFQGSAHHIERC